MQNEKLTVKSDVFEKLMTIYSLSIEELKKIIEDMEVKYQDINLIDHVKYRIKSPKSIINKMKKDCLLEASKYSSEEIIKIIGTYLEG